MLTLTEALQAIADRSFYEDAIVEDSNCFDGSGDSLTDCEDCDCDRTVGWALLAFDHGPADN